MNTSEQHAEMVKVLVKPPVKIFLEMTEEKCALMHDALGLAGEAGELVDCIKKHLAYNQPLNRVNAIEELGDIEFFLEDIRKRIGVTREQCLQANIDKLAERYKGFKYTDQRAKERVDKLPSAL